MEDDLPEYYFRVRENGAMVFRVTAENRQRRSELEQIAVANLRNSEIKPQGDRKLTTADQKAIRDWMADRMALLARRETDDMLRTADQLNAAAQWAQSRASDAQLEAVSDTLLLAMHDLRSVLVRKKAERVVKRKGATTAEDSGRSAG